MKNTKKSKLKTLVVGGSGKMGHELFHVLSNSLKLEPTANLSRHASPHFTTNYNNFKNVKNKFDVVIDFSQPEVLSEVIQYCVKNKTALVCGTTGISEVQKKKLVDAGRQVPVLWSPNMSLGIAFMKHLLSQYQMIADFDFQVQEFHHNQKKDKPGGTAILLQEHLSKVVGKQLPEVLAVRGGGIFGIHQVYAMSNEEVIQLEHQALSRRVFAKGAVQVAEWLIGQKPGFYSIDDYFKFKKGSKK